MAGKKKIKNKVEEVEKTEEKANEIKEEIEEEIETPLKEDIKKKQNRQVMIAIFLMIAVTVIILATPFIYAHFFTKFTYMNLEFQKTKLGKIDFYSTRIPIVNKAPVPGELIDRKSAVAQYSINFRTDPRKAGYIKINTTFNNTNQIDFVKANTAYISLDPSMEKCDVNSVALINFAGILRDFAGLQIKSAVSDENASRELKIPYVTCKKNEWNTVINIRSGNETKIEKTGKNCYELVYKDCEIMEVTEKFNLLVIENYMKYFKE